LLIFSFFDASFRYFISSISSSAYAPIEDYCCRFFFDSDFSLPTRRRFFIFDASSFFEPLIFSASSPPTLFLSLRFHDSC
jgi:hypothetical protein